MYKKSSQIIRKVFVLPIYIYQKTFSFDHGPLKRFFPYGYCKFYPSCSEYMIRAIERKGILRGSLLGAYRIGRCNPFSKGGIDLSCDNQKKEAI